MNNPGIYIAIRNSREVIAIYLTLRGQGKIIWKAIFDAMRGLPKMIGKRKFIQKNNKIKSGELLKVMSTGLFEPLQEFIHRNKHR